MTTWFTSDLHFGHQNIINYCRRPFHSVENMNKLLIQQWNEVVDDADDVIVLGDVAMGKIAETLPLVKELKGHKFLVPGNHDRCWSGYGKKAAQWVEKYEDVGFTIMPEFLTVNYPFVGDGTRVNLCHFPVVGDSQEEDRYTGNRPQVDEDEILFHGHIHNEWKSRGRHVNVGVDVWGYYPVSLEDLLKEAGCLT